MWSCYFIIFLASYVVLFGEFVIREFLHGIVFCSPILHDVHLYYILFIIYVIKIPQCCVSIIQRAVMLNLHHNGCMYDNVMSSRYSVISNYHSVRFVYCGVMSVHYSVGLVSFVVFLFSCSFGKPSNF